MDAQASAQSAQPQKISDETIRLRALETLWAAIKEWNSDGTGYTPKLAAAVAELKKLEAGL